MFDTLIARVRHLRSTDGGRSLEPEVLTQNGSDRVIEDRRDGEPSYLFRCPSCETVYIDTDKEVCSTCSSAVEQVPATLDETDNF